MLPGVLRISFSCALACAAPSCLTPPALLEAQVFPFESARALYPPASEAVELRSESGATLRGLFVPAGSGAPVVLHLLDSSGSLAGIGSDFGEVAARLADMGFASLLCDYSGVGVSDGERSVANLVPDARAFWDEAVRRAGDPSRVVIRAVSIGTFPAARLLADGIRPQALILYGPVFPETVTARFAWSLLNPFAWFAAVFVFRPIARFDPCAPIAASGAPCTAIVSVEDSLLSEDERTRLKTAILASGGNWFHAWGDHIAVGAQARQVSVWELATLSGIAPSPEEGFAERLWARLPVEVASRLPSGSAQRGRFDWLAGNQRSATPQELAAAALANDDMILSSRMLWLARRHPFPSLEFDDLVAALSLRAPRKELELSIETIELVSAFSDLAWRYERVAFVRDPALIAKMAASSDAAGNTYSFGCQLRCGLKVSLSFSFKKNWDALVAQGATPDEASVYWARVLLKAQRTPDRLRLAPDGTLQLEAYWKDRWQPVVSAPAGAPSADAASVSHAER